MVNDIERSGRRIESSSNGVFVAGGILLIPLRWPTVTQLREGRGVGVAVLLSFCQVDRFGHSADTLFFAGIPDQSVEA